MQVIDFMLAFGMVISPVIFFGLPVYYYYSRGGDKLKPFFQRYRFFNVFLISGCFSVAITFSAFYSAMQRLCRGISGEPLLKWGEEFYSAREILCGSLSACITACIFIIYFLSLRERVNTHKEEEKQYSE